VLRIRNHLDYIIDCLEGEALLWLTEGHCWSRGLTFVNHETIMKEQWN